MSGTSSFKACNNKGLWGLKHSFVMVSQICWELFSLNLWDFEQKLAQHFANFIQLSWSFTCF